MTAAVPDPRFRAQLAEALREHRQLPLAISAIAFPGCSCGWPYPAKTPGDLRVAAWESHRADAIAAEVEARVQAAAKHGAAEERGRWITALGVLAARHSLRWFALELRDRAAALVPAASEER